jgi:hypothetical protein
VELLVEDVHVDAGAIWVGTPLAVQARTDDLRSVIMDDECFAVL